MRFLFILSATAIVSVLAVPSASIAAVSAEPSTNVREKTWGRMKVALPDGVFQDDKLTKQENILPLLVAEEHLSENQGSSNLAYKNLEFTDHIKITLLPPSEQLEMNELNDAVHAEKDFEVVALASDTGRRYKKYIENVESQSMSSAEPSGVHQKKLVGMDLNGQMRYFEIPYYNRAST